MAVSNEEKMLKERIRHLLTYKRASVASLADNENERVRLRHQINDDALVQYSTLYKLLYMFHDISAEWLVRGEGTMTRSGEGAPRFYTTNNVHDNHAGGDINVGPEVHTSKQIDELKKKLDEVTADRDFLKKLLDAMTTK